MPRTVTLIGKGPTAVHAAEWIQGDVAVINDAARVLPDSHEVGWCFFTDVELIRKARPDWDRTQRFVSPEFLHLDCVRSKLTPADIGDGFPLHKHASYPYRICNGLEPMLRRFVRAGLVAHHSTAVAAHHYLSMQGYELIRVIGCDGGRGYAPGFDGTISGHNFSGWREIQERLARVLLEELGTRTEWFSDAVCDPGEDDQHQSSE